MNHAYQHKKGPPKMVKDLKFGADAHLRQSLLDITQIENLNKIFIGRKTHYKIDDQSNQSVSKQREPTQNESCDTEFQSQQFVLSPQQNLQLIKKQRITNKMKDKMKQMFKPQQVRKFKLRKPVLHNLLEDFKSSFRVEQQPKFRQALKCSQKNLEHIKINNKKRVSSHYIRASTSQSRSKFVSISTGMPVISKNYFPTFSDFVEGKYKRKQEPFVGIDISKIQSYFSTMMTQPPTLSSFGEKKSSKDEYIKYLNKSIVSKSSIRSVNASPIVHSSQEDKNITSLNDVLIHQQLTRFNKTEQSRAARSKSAINPNVNFKKSQESSKKVINAMQTYYSLKKQKTRQCDTIVEYMKQDRPLTSHLRRKNYTVIGNIQIDNVQKYRQRSQEERIKILERNYDFYISLLKIFQHCKEDQIKTSLRILSKLKEFFQSEYLLLHKDVMTICKLNQGQVPDFGVRIILQNMMEFAKKQNNLDTENEEEYQFL